MGGITWSNGFDFCPNFLRSLAENETKTNLICVVE